MLAQYNNALQGAVLLDTIESGLQPTPFIVYFSENDFNISNYSRMFSRKDFASASCVEPNMLSFTYIWHTAYGIKE